MNLRKDKEYFVLQYYLSSDNFAFSHMQKHHTFCEKMKIYFLKKNKILSGYLLIYLL